MTLIRGLGAPDIRRRGVGTLQLSVGALFAGSFTPFSTTDTATLFSMGFVDFWLQDENAHIYVPTAFQVAHSVAGGRFHVFWLMYDVDDDGVATNGVTFWRRDFTACPLASEWLQFAETPIFLAPGHNTGRKRIYWTIQNTTAGTLFVGSVGTSSAGAFILGTVGG